MKKILTLIWAVFILFPGLSQAQQVTDANLQNCIAAAAGGSFDSLTDKDFLDITRIDCEKKNIVSIEGIENLANLVELGLNDNRIKDISPLAGLDRLTKLYLWHNRIADISPLAGLKQLQELHIWSNEIGDLGPLAKLNMLEELLLGENQIADLGPLAGLTRLNWLEIFNNQVTDITPLKGLGRLEYLDASVNNISDVSALRELRGLARLHLNGNSITDIKGLVGLKSIRRLSLGYNQISDISPLANLAELLILDLSANNVDDIAPLRNLASLRRLTLDNNLLSNISPLAGLPHLYYVSLLNNCIKSIIEIGYVRDVSGMEYQHNLCSSPNLVRRTVTREWLKDQVDRQCVAFGENDYSLRNSFDHYTDGLYYRYYVRDKQGTAVQKMICRLPWNTSPAEVILPIEKVEVSGKNYELFKFGGYMIYVQQGKMKGVSLKRQVIAGYENIFDTVMDNMKVRYDIKKSFVEGSTALTAKKESYVMREIPGETFQTLQFFESDFYSAEISKGQ